MLRGEEGAVADLAASVADGDTVDWSVAAGGIPDPQRRLVSHLQLVHTISQLYRTLPSDDSRPEPPPPLTRWGNFLLLERIGEGTTGEVYRAWDSQLHRDVALKLLHQDRRRPGDAQERVLEEARRLARVRHEHVVSVYGAEAHDGRVGMWMELVRGESLDERVKREGPLGSEEAARIGRQLCSALSAVHAAGLVHRDVKAQNVVQEPSGRIVLMDFGTGEDLRRAAGTNRMAGTPLYLAPEIFTGEPATVQTDIYSLGVLLFYLVTGEFPVTARSLPELGRAHREGTRRGLAELRPDLPATFVQGVERALESDSARRYRSGGEMETALRLAPEMPAAVTATSKPLSAASRWGFMAAAAALLALTVALIVWTRQTTAPSPAAAGEIKTVRVMPMTSIDPTAAPAFFAEGLTDQLIATLGQIRSLRVKVGVAGAEEAAPEPASQNDVEAILETTLYAAGAGSSPRVRVNARLITAGTRTILWTRTFERALGDTFSLQAQMAREIAAAVNAAITSDERLRLDQSRQTTAAAELAFLEGRAYIAKYDVANRKAALQAFQRAIDADPSHAGAHAGAARAYFSLGFANEISQPVARALALAAAQKAIALDDTLPEAHATLADLSFYYDWNWQGAEESYIRSLRLNSSFAYGRMQYAQFLAAARRTREAVAQAEEVVDQNPTLAEAHRTLGLMLYYHRDFGAAERAIRHALALDSTAPGGWVILGRIAEARGQPQEALQHTERAIELSDGSPAMLRVQRMRQQVLTGEEAQARRALEELRREFSERATLWTPQINGYVHLAMGDHDQALTFLEEAVELRDPRLLWLAVDPRMDSLRANPRFGRILRALGPV